MLNLKYPTGRIRNFPGVTPELSAAAIGLMNGVAPDPAKYNTTHHCYQHFRAVAARAASASPEKLQFFNAAPADFTVNTPQQGQINDDEFFWGMRLKIDLLVNNTAAQANGTAIATQITGAAGIPLSVQNAEEARQFLNTGRVNFSIGGRKIVENVYGVHRFASGSGVAMQGAVAGVNSTNIYAPVMPTNGNPDKFNGWDFTPWVWLGRGRTMDLAIDWNATNLITTNSFLWCVTLEGIRITTGNV